MIDINILFATLSVLSLMFLVGVVTAMCKIRLHRSIILETMRFDLFLELEKRAVNEWFINEEMIAQHSEEKTEIYKEMKAERDMHRNVAIRAVDQRNDADSENDRLQKLLYEATKEQPQTAQQFLDDHPELVPFERGFLEFIAAQELEDAQVAALRERNKMKTARFMEMYSGPVGLDDAFGTSYDNVAAFHKLCDSMGSSL
jgi:hypothetical protein